MPITSPLPTPGQNPWDATFGTWAGEVEDSVHDIEALTDTGRLSETELDAEYVPQYGDATAQRLLRKLDAGVNATWLNFGDSLSADPEDWVYQAALRLATYYPAQSVNYQTANAAGWVGTPTGVQVGTGTGVFSVRNAAVGAYSSDQWADAINAGVISGVTPDVITIFTSHNDSDVPAVFYSEFEGLLTAIATAWPSIPVIVGIQNQSTTEPDQTEAHREWILDIVRGRPGVAVHEYAWKAFGEFIPIAAYYIDNVHPTPVGQVALRNAWLAALGMPQDAVKVMVDRTVSPVQAQMSALIKALGNQFDPITMLPWAHAYWAEDPGWTHPGDGVKVASWDDAVGTADLAQAVTAEQPTYRATIAPLGNKPGVQFVAANNESMLGAIASLAQPYTLVIVGDVTSVAAAGTLADINASTTNNSFYNGVNTTAGVVWQINQGTPVRGGTPVANTGVLFVGRFTGTTSHLDINNVSVATGNAGNQPAAEMRLGRSVAAAATTAPLSGHIAFVGLIAGDVKSDPGWTLFTAWVTAHYGIPMAG